MKIVITGISGFVGQAMLSHFKTRGDDVLGLSIRSDTPLERIANVLEGSDAVINLAGANILSRWSEAYKRALYHSRIDTTRKLVDALGRCTKRPGVLLNASAVGIYKNGVRADERGAQGEDFLASLCKDWESEANRAKRHGVRVALMRFGVIYGPGGGAMQKMLTPFRLGVGGKLGGGAQMVSWIHIDDLVRAVMHIIECETLHGPFNFTAPEPLSNTEQTHLLADALHRPAWFTVPEVAVKLLFGEGATVMLDSKEAVPAALTESGFSFRYPTFGEAVADIIGR